MDGDKDPVMAGTLDIALVDVSEADQPNNIIYTQSKTDAYTLNIGKSLSKKLSSCDRDLYSLDIKSNCFVMEMNSAVFELLRLNLLPLLVNDPKYIIKVTQKTDQEGNVACDIIRV